MSIEEDVKRICDFIEKHKYNFEGKLVQRAYDRQEQELNDVKNYIKHYEESTAKLNKEIETLKAKLAKAESNNVIQIASALLQSNVAIESLNLHKVLSADLDSVDSIIAISKEIIRKIEQ